MKLELVREWGLIFMCKLNYNLTLEAENDKNFCQIQ